MDSRIKIRKNMKTINKIKMLLVLVVLFLSNTLVYAQEDFTPDTEDVAPAAPINNWVLPMFILAVGIGFYLLRKQQQQVVK